MNLLLSDSFCADRRSRLLPTLFLLLCAFTVPLAAHQPGNSSLVLYVGEDNVITGEYHVADVDLESLNLMLEDRARRNQQPAGESAFDPASDGVRALPFLSLIIDGEPLVFTPLPPQRVESEGRPHTMIPFVTGFVGGDGLEVRFNEFFTFDPQHRVVTSLERDGDTKVGLITLNAPIWAVTLSEPGAWSQFVHFTWEGVWHIWIGIDHILFLIALLLPSVLRFVDGRWQPVSNFHDAFINLLKVVTAFTVAHSVTLSLAALQIITLPSKLVETVIAISVVLAALNNIFPVVRDRTWTVAFGFGLIHGFGFANVLADLQLPSGTLAVALLSFNIGVELGQIAIVFVFFPIAFVFRTYAFYKPVKLQLGSALIALIACTWTVERVFDLSLLPF